MSIDEVADLNEFSPPAWGWTVAARIGCSKAAVFLTRVGMDRYDDGKGYRRHGFPHPRGDGPKLLTESDLCLMFSPPAWGWTDMEIAYVYVSEVFPTRVGMDRLP